MTPMSQIELHPDADSLNAFVEQALAVSEREQILAHLAACSRCRQVIYLAQMTSEESAPERTLATPAATQPFPWLRSWRLILAPALALASALGLVFVLPLKHTTKAPEITRLAPQTEEGALRPPAPQPPAAQAAHPQAPATSAKAGPMKRDLASPRASTAGPAAVAAGPADNSPRSDAASLQTVKNNQWLAPVAPPPPGLAAPPAMAQFKPEPETPALEIYQQRIAPRGPVSAAPAHTSTAGFRGAPVHGQASRAVSVAAAPPIEPQPILTNNLAIAAQGPMTQALPSRELASLRLPSGLTATSTATTQHRTLAIDVTGAVFLSEDAGKNWKPVVRQWTGRAVQVRVQPSVNAPPVPAPVLELINENGLIWRSTDGNTWAMQ